MGPIAEQLRLRAHEKGVALINFGSGAADDRGRPLRSSRPGRFRSENGEAGVVISCSRYVDSHSVFSEDAKEYKDPVINGQHWTGADEMSDEDDEPFLVEVVA